MKQIVMTGPGKSKVVEVPIPEIDDNQLLVKRIAACPGDEVDLRELRYMKDTVIPVWEKPVLTVPDNCYYVLGDNVDHSFDSRYWDDPFVKREDVVAVLFIN